MFSKKRKHPLSLLLGLIVALAASHCGGGASAPTVTIPAPIVTKITISAPENGVSTITGLPGAVTGGNTVQAKNLSKEGLVSEWEKIFWGIAYAATTVQTVAAADGSFSMQIEASLGDVIRITQIDSSGNEGSAADVTAPYRSLDLSFAPEDIAVDPDSATAYLVGNSGGEGQVVPLTYGASPSLGSAMTLPALCNDPTAAAVDGTRDRLVLVDFTHGTVCSQSQSGGTATILGTLTVIPTNIALDANSNTAVITNASGQVTVEVSLLNLANDTFTAVGLPNPAGGEGQLFTAAVDTARSDATNYALVIVTYTGPRDFAFLINLDTATVIGSGSELASVGTPGELKIYSNNKALLTDSDGFAHLLQVDVAGGTVFVSRTLTVGSDALGVDINTTNNQAFVANQGSNTLSVIDLTSGTEQVTSTLTMRDGPKQIGFKNSSINQTAVVHGRDRSVVIMSK